MALDNDPKIAHCIRAGWYRGSEGQQGMMV